MRYALRAGAGLFPRRHVFQLRPRRRHPRAAVLPDALVVPPARHADRAARRLCRVSPLHPVGISLFASDLDLLRSRHRAERTVRSRGLETLQGIEVRRPSALSGLALTATAGFAIPSPLLSDCDTRPSRGTI